MNSRGANLTTWVNGIELQNPFILASAPPTATEDLIRRAFKAGWAGAVTKTIKPDSMRLSNVSPRFHTLTDSTGAVIGFENIELVSMHDEAYWEKTIASLKKEYPDRAVIASIMGGNEPGTWQSLARKMEKAGADALELNFSCPHGMPEFGVGAAIGQAPETTARITAWVKNAVSIPVIVKLTPNVTDVRTIAKAAVGAGADALAAINTVESITGVDLDKMQPYPLVADGSVYGGYSGAGVKPIGLKAVAQIAREVNVPIYGMGGIRSWQDAAEYISLGANAVQICTEVMVKGFSIIRGLIDGLSKFVDRKGYSGVSDFRGLAAKKISSHEALERKVTVRPVITRPEDCTRCGKCVTACRDGGYQAIKLVDRLPTFDLNLCDGCSLCSHVCPRRIIDMRSVS